MEDDQDFCAMEVLHQITENVLAVSNQNSTTLFSILDFQCGHPHTISYPKLNIQANSLLLWLHDEEL